MNQSPGQTIDKILTEAGWDAATATVEFLVGKKVAMFTVRADARIPAKLDPNPTPRTEAEKVKA